MIRKLSVLFCVIIYITLSLTNYIYAEGNLITNGSFEEVQDGVPVGWSIYTYHKDEGASEFKVESGEACDGNNYVTIVNNVQNDSRYIQTVSAQPNKNYKLSCYIKCENISDSGNGAILSVEGQVTGSKPLKNTDGLWEYVELYVKTMEGVYSFNVTVGVGGYGAESSGKASFDNVTVEEIDTIPDGAIVAIVESPNQDNSPSNNQSESDIDNSESENKPAKNRTIWIILAICILVTAAAIYNTFKSSSSEESSKTTDSTSSTSDNEHSEDSEEVKESEEKSNDSGE
ncbi:hypothetical protein [Acetivibrio clariflavus]|uniref:hypothetical protein n=1 Tax=Acetivibrio clariflavus TaxID=288965 RepID=UPI0004887BC9|nr:hypothetical protein [Acetivibrio clariflavus]